MRKTLEAFENWKLEKNDREQLSENSKSNIQNSAPGECRPEGGEESEVACANNLKNRVAVEKK